MTDFEVLLRKAGYSVPQAAEHLDYSEGHIYRWIRGEERPRDAIIRLLELEIDRRRQPDSGAGFTFIDLFAGIGGLARPTIGASVVRSPFAFEQIPRQPLECLPVGRRGQI